MVSIIMKKSIICIFLLLILGCGSVSAYEQHDPIIIRQPIPDNSASNPLIIEGYEITNPGGPCIFVENVEYIIIRNNYLHDCGTDISAELIANNPRDDDCVGEMSDFMNTGALDIFRSLSVEISNNKMINNDYSIRVDGFNRRMENVNIFDNIVHNTHRSHFIWVAVADNVNIYNNDVRHNGLGEFFDNEALAKILEGENLGCNDGRSQGILISKCDNAKIYDNFVLNSSSDGIGIVGDPKEPSTDVEVYGNEIVESGEQGIWLAGAHDIKIYRNKVYQSKHRVDEQGGNSGIMIETDTINAEIYENEVYYNDMYGVSMTAGSNINIHDNDIYYNGDGGIGIKYLDYIGDEGIENIAIKNNKIHNNRICAISVDNDHFEGVMIEGNTFIDNGGNPIHHEFYEDNDFSLHLEDGIEGPINVFDVNPSDLLNRLTIGENTGYPVSDEYLKEKKKEKTPKQMDEDRKKTHDRNDNDSILDELRESWEATLIILLFVVVIFIIIICKKRIRDIFK